MTFIADYIVWDWLESFPWQGRSILYILIQDLLMKNGEGKNIVFEDAIQRPVLWQALKW